jgi:hypothetical protein
MKLEIHVYCICCVALCCVWLQLLTICVPCKQILVIPFNRHTLLIVEWKTDKWSIRVQVHRSHGESSNICYIRYFRSITRFILKSGASGLKNSKFTDVSGRLVGRSYLPLRIPHPSPGYYPCMALGSTQPPKEMSTRYNSWGGSKRVTTLPLSWADCLEIWEPQRPGTLTVCSGTALPLLFLSALQPR